jgi:hypothetical protein
MPVLRRDFGDKKKNFRQRFLMCAKNLGVANSLLQRHRDGRKPYPREPVSDISRGLCMEGHNDLLLFDLGRIKPRRHRWKLSRLPGDDVKANVDHTFCDRLIIQPRQQGLGGFLPNGGAVDLHRRQGRKNVRSKVLITEPDDGNILRDAQPSRLGLRNHALGESIGTAKYRTRTETLIE